MLNNKTKIFLLCSIILIAMVGISSVSATDADDMTIDTQSTAVQDVPILNDDNIEDNMAKDVQSTSNVDSSLKAETKESTKTVEKEDKNIKELAYNDPNWDFSLDYAHEIQSGSNLTVNYYIGSDEMTHVEYIWTVPVNHSISRIIGTDGKRIHAL